MKVKQVKKVNNELKKAKESLEQLLNDETGVTNESIWELDSWIDKTPKLTPEVKATMLKHLKTFIGSCVLPYIENAITETER